MRLISHGLASQDQMRVVKSRLLEMLPEVKVFLGVPTTIIGPPPWACSDCAPAY
jgi:hypothetical protein